MFPSNLTAEFNVDAMKQMLIASAAAYCKASEAESIARSHGATEFYWIESKATDTQAFVAVSGGDIVLSVRGTSSLRDVVTDCKFLRRRWNTPLGFGLEVHDGFASACESIQQDVHDALFAADAFHVEKRIWLGAHSLGAGVICPLAIYIRENLGHINGVYTFGKPRVGDAAYRDYYNFNLRDITFCIENRNDIVTRVPGALAGFRKEGTICFMDAFGGVDVNPPLWKKLVSDTGPFVSEIITGHPAYLSLKNIETAITDHLINAYKTRILG